MRLIDADDFIEYLGLDAENAREDNIGEIVTLEDFDRQATAFDKEKVIEELKGEIELCVTHPLYPGRYIKKDRAVEIVEKGGIE